MDPMQSDLDRIRNLEATVLSLEERLEELEELAKDLEAIAGRSAHALMEVAKIMAANSADIAELNGNTDRAEKVRQRLKDAEAMWKEHHIGD